MVSEGGCVTTILKTDNQPKSGKNFTITYFYAVKIKNGSQSKNFSVACTLTTELLTKTII